MVIEADAEVFPFDELEGDEVEAAVLAAEISPGDILVVELGGGAGLFLEAANVLGVGGHLRGEDFQGDDPPKVEVAGLDDGGHSTGACLLDQLELPKAHAFEGVFAEDGLGIDEPLPRARDDGGRILVDLLGVGPGGDSCGFFH